MNKTILYSSLTISVLIFIIALCLFVVKIDYIKVCYFVNDGSSSSLIVDKKTNQFIDDTQNKNCIITINEHKYKAHLTYDEYVDKGCRYWISIDLNQDLPIMEGLVKCNFGGQTLIKHFI